MISLSIFVVLYIDEMMTWITINCDYCMLYFHIILSFINNYKIIHKKKKKKNYKIIVYFVLFLKLLL